MYLTVHHLAVYKVIENTITLLSLIKYLYFSLSLSPFSALNRESNPR